MFYTNTAVAGLRCRYDLDNDGEVRIGDIQVIASHWHAQPAGTPFDLDGDQIVTIWDIMTVVTQLGQGCATP